MNAIIEQLRKAHEAAYNVYSILSDISEQLRMSDDVLNSDVEEQIEDLTGIADELQSELFDVLENL